MSICTGAQTDPAQNWRVWPADFASMRARLAETRSRRSTRSLAADLSGFALLSRCALLSQVPHAASRPPRPRPAPACDACGKSSIRKAPDSIEARIGSHTLALSQADQCSTVSHALNFLRRRFIDARRGETERIRLVQERAVSVAARPSEPRVGRRQNGRGRAPIPPQNHPLPPHHGE